MDKPVKTVAADRALRIEAYHFQGLARPFPLHFHPHYVVGLVERGARRLTCKGREAALGPGQLFLLNPGDSHACAQCGEEPLDYRSVTLPIETMLDLAEDLTGARTLPVFPAPVADDPETACQLRVFHDLILNGGGRFAREEVLLLLMAGLLERHSPLPPPAVPACRAEVDHARAYMEAHFAERIGLEQLCRQVGLSKSTLLRAFTQARGLTPYRYLETVRINAAKRLLEQGASPLEAALQTGFSDQSHFTNYFTSFIGVTPGLYRDILRGRQNEKGEQHGLSE
nr:AraC family transcriptional regulator [uncultured Oscillibacter sp.]